MSFNSIVSKSMKGLTNLTIGENATLTVLGAVSGASVAPVLHVDTVTGVNAVDRGTSWSNPLATMTYALSLVATGGKILFRGDVREECIGSNLVFDVTIEGAGALHHADLPAAGYHTGAAIWRAPAAETGTTPLLQVRGRGWTFKNFMVAAPSDAAAFKLMRNALSGTSEYDASHATFENIRSAGGEHFIEDSGGCYNITVKNCQIAQSTAAAILNSSTSVANPLNWKILDNIFPADTSDFGNVTHIDSPLNSGILAGNVFGKVRSTAKYVDLTGGNNNIVTGNVLGGEYDTSNYVSGTGDEWMQNTCAVTATVAPDGRSIAVPTGA